MYLVRFFNFKNESVSETTFSTGDVELQRSFLNKLFKIFLEQKKEQQIVDEHTDENIQHLDEVLTLQQKKRHQMNH